MEWAQVLGSWGRHAALLCIAMVLFAGCRSTAETPAGEARMPEWGVGTAWEQPPRGGPGFGDGRPFTTEGTEGNAGERTAEVRINVGDNIQEVIDAHPPGTTFRIASGRHVAQQVVPRSGDTFIGDPGAVLDGDFQVEYAFVAFDPERPVRDVTIRGLLIERYATPLSQGTLGGGGAERWTIEGNEIRLSRGGGIGVNDGMLIRGNFIHDNQQIGLIVGTPSSDILIEENEIAFNNPDRVHDMAWEAGGAKFARTTGLVARRNYVHDNGGAGLWTDGFNARITYEQNLIAENAGPGIHHEISYSAQIVDNCLTGNAIEYFVGGILVVSSSDVLVSGNVLFGNDGGVVAIQDRREPGPDGRRLLLRDVVVTENAMSYESGITGLVWQAPFEPEGDVVEFHGNSYRVGSRAHAFQWLDDMWTLAQWTEANPRDADDTTVVQDCPSDVRRGVAAGS